MTGHAGLKGHIEGLNEMEGGAIEGIRVGDPVLGAGPDAG